MTSATYLYCLVQGKRPPLPKKGLEGAGKIRVLDAGGIALVVADAPLDRYGEEAIARGLKDMGWVSSRAAEHEAVVEHYARAATVIPMKLFTLFAGDERALAHVKKLRKGIDRDVQRIAGASEWGVRILLDESRALKKAETEARASAGKMTGASFLLMKKKIADAKGEINERAAASVDAVVEDLSSAAREVQRRPPVNREMAGRVLLDAVFLVDRKSEKGFEKAVKRAVESLGGAYDVVLTGPWPAYHFVGGKR
jgi:hypothetical protein